MIRRSCLDFIMNLIIAALRLFGQTSEPETEIELGSARALACRFPRLAENHKRTRMCQRFRQRWNANRLDARARPATPGADVPPSSAFRPEGVTRSTDQSHPAAKAGVLPCHQQPSGSAP